MCSNRVRVSKRVEENEPERARERVYVRERVIGDLSKQQCGFKRMLVSTSI